MMVDSVSIKVYCEEGDRKNIRRFSLDKDVSSIFSRLQEKLGLVFPQIRNHSFSILWTDDEGDMITVCNDEDLKIAFTDMKGPVYKFVIRMVEDNASEKQVNIHPGAMCDGCQGKVFGFRYKNLVCEDFDLCKDCEFSGVHPEHSMIRISNPHVIWPHQVFSPIGILSQLDKINKEKGQKMSDTNSCSQDPTIKDMLGPVFEMMVKVLTSDQATDGERNKREKKVSESPHKNQCNDGESDGFTKNSRQSTIEIPTAAEHLTKPYSDNQHQKLETEDGGQEKVIDESPTTIEPEKEKNPMPQSFSHSADEGEIDDSEKRGEANQSLPKVLYASYDGTLYPTLPENNPEKMVPSISPESKTPKGEDEHADPKINVTLQAMLNMGFTNDRGWLTNLLMAKQGDIGNTLDVIKPSGN